MCIGCGKPDSCFELLATFRFSKVLLNFFDFYHLDTRKNQTMLSFKRTKKKIQVLKNTTTLQEKQWNFCNVHLLCLFSRSSLVLFRVVSEI